MKLKVYLMAVKFNNFALSWEDVQNSGKAEYLDLLKVAEDTKLKCFQKIALSLLAANVMLNCGASSSGFLSMLNVSIESVVEYLLEGK